MPKVAMLVTFTTQHVGTGRKRGDGRRCQGTIWQTKLPDLSDFYRRLASGVRGVNLQPVSAANRSAAAAQLGQYGQKALVCR
jgi:hypothetical protein